MKFDDSTEASTMRVLVIEDEVLLAMHLEDMLSSLGHQVAAVATRVDKALPLARSGDIDLAILDLNLAGTPSYPVADILRGRAIPFIFATGYGARGVIDGYRQECVLTKPFGPAELERAIARATANPLSGKTIPS